MINCITGKLWFLYIKKLIPVLFNRSFYTVCLSVHMHTVCLCTSVNIFMLQFVISVSVYGNFDGVLSVFHLFC